MKNRTGIFSLTLLTALMSATAVQAHSDATIGAGFLHPISGLDHLLALLAVGIWAGRAGSKIKWRVPSIFIAFTLLGAAITMHGLTLPSIQTVVFSSVAIFFVLAAISIRLSTRTAGIVTAMFAFFHGAAHGTIAGAAPISFVAGFLAASIVVLGIGVIMGAALTSQRNNPIDQKRPKHCA
ncbi:MAG: HupE/UreJ family protein [Pseudomonadota bacterium]|nr:HupE/UreJ family protein [Pseudomonadota bacterium]